MAPRLTTKESELLKDGSKSALEMVQLKMDAALARLIEFETQLEEAQVALAMAANPNRICSVNPPEEFDLSFGQLVAGNSCVVNSGSCIVGNTRLDVAETTLSLTGSVAYVYAYALKDLSSAGVNFMATDPLAIPLSGTEYRWRLVKCEAIGVGSYLATKHYWHGGDLTAYAPLGA